MFERIASFDGSAKGLFSAEALTGYAQALARDVRVDEVQAVLNELMAAPARAASGRRPKCSLTAFWTNIPP